mmetsp:Transcript_8380/g.30921  ORF Transcript_8380/g.30921 Transcript_8380/m.30921 type:complete len:210 (+) Transcript_8380:287-916(+)
MPSSPMSCEGSSVWIRLTTMFRWDSSGKFSFFTFHELGGLTICTSKSIGSVRMEMAELDFVTLTAWIWYPEEITGKLSISLSLTRIWPQCHAVRDVDGFVETMMVSRLSEGVRTSLSALIHVPFGWYGLSSAFVPIEMPDVYAVEKFAMSVMSSAFDCRIQYCWPALPMKSNCAPSRPLKCGSDLTIGSIVSVGITSSFVVATWYLRIG